MLCSTGETIGTVTELQRKDESIGYTAQIRLKEGGKVVFPESKTFDRKLATLGWLDKRERELAQLGARRFAKQEDSLLADVIDRVHSGIDA